MSICGLYFPESAPLIREPQEKNYFQDVKYLDDEVPMWAVSFSNVILQDLLDTRDCILSKSPEEMGGYTKIGIVTILCLTAAVGYTVLNIAETYVRGVAGIIGTIVLAPLAIIAFYCGFSAKGGLVLPLFGGGAAASLIGGLIGALQGTCQVGAGFFAAYQMATDTKSRSLPVDKLVDVASYGIPIKIFNTLGKLFD